MTTNFTNDAGTGVIAGDGLTISGLSTSTIAGNVSFTGNTTMANPVSQGNISGGNLTLTGAAAITGNVTAGNVTATIVATGGITKTIDVESAGNITVVNGIITKFA